MISQQTISELDSLAEISGESVYEMVTTKLRRLLVIDQQLQSSGLCIAEFADQHACTIKTVNRDLSLIRKLVGPTRLDHGPPYRHFYKDTQ